MSRLEIWAATPAPFDAQGQVDVSVIAAQAAHLASTGVHGAFVNGTTGEFPALSTTERMAIAEAWARARPDGFGLALHVGGTDPDQVRQLAAQAEALGVDFVAAVAPYYGQAPTVELVVGYLTMVAASAPTTPLCYYHIPSMTGSTHAPSAVVAAAAAAIPTLASVKFTDGDLIEYDRVREAADGLTVYFGRDELLPAALSFGALAVIGSLYNGLAPIAHQVTDAHDRGEYELAFDLHRPFREIAEAAGRHGGVGFIKELMNELGPDAGRPRTPWGPLSPADRAAAAELATRLRSHELPASRTGAGRGSR
ncbi:dihydrodipicolinate synthase family protein [Polymorphospora rubra]|uniref:dihydrodipicolinate synthase family protein n=1 Tax=Polymorphospora rubra TaxID=338584 RepID=UPI0033FA0C62